MDCILERFNLSKEFSQENMLSRLLTRNNKQSKRVLAVDNVNLLIYSDYQDWTTPFKQDRFPKIHLWTRHWRGVAPLINSHCLGVKSLTRTKGFLPAVLFLLHHSQAQSRPILIHPYCRIQTTVSLQGFWDSIVNSQL